MANNLVVLSLIENRCNIETTHGGRTILNHACKDGNEEIVKALLESNCNVNRTAPLVEAHHSVIDLLLSNKASVNCQTSWQGLSPLMYNVNNSKIALRYIEEGCDLHLKNIYDETALEMQPNDEFLRAEMCRYINDETLERIERSNPRYFTELRKNVFPIRLEIDALCRLEKFGLSAVLIEEISKFLVSEAFSAVFSQ